MIILCHGCNIMVHMVVVNVEVIILKFYCTKNLSHVARPITKTKLNCMDLPSTALLLPKIKLYSYKNMGVKI